MLRAQPAAAASPPSTNVANLSQRLRLWANYAMCHVQCQPTLPVPACLHWRRYLVVLAKNCSNHHLVRKLDDSGDGSAGADAPKSGAGALRCVLKREQGERVRNRVWMRERLGFSSVHPLRLFALAATWPAVHNWCTSHAINASGGLESATELSSELFGYTHPHTHALKETCTHPSTPQIHLAQAPRWVHKKVFNLDPE